MLVLGITGGVATGKSTVARIFGLLGAPVISADEIAAELLQPGTALTRAVLSEFPMCRVPSGPETWVIDRRALASVIFTDAAARKRLDMLTHPPIVERLASVFAKWRTETGKAAVAEIPLLFESGLEKITDAVIVVVCQKGTQIERLQSGRNLSLDEAERWVGAQWSLERKKALANYVIDSGTSLDATQAQAAAIWNVL